MTNAPRPRQRRRQRRKRTTKKTTTTTTTTRRMTTESRDRGRDPRVPARAGTDSAVPRGARATRCRDADVPVRAASSPRAFADSSASRQCHCRCRRCRRRRHCHCRHYHCRYRCRCEHCRASCCAMKRTSAPREAQMHRAMRTTRTRMRTQDRRATAAAPACTCPSGRRRAVRRDSIGSTARGRSEAAAVAAIGAAEWVYHRPPIGARRTQRSRAANATAAANAASERHCRVAPTRALATVRRSHSHSRLPRQRAMTRDDAPTPVH